MVISKLLHHLLLHHLPCLHHLLQQPVIKAKRARVVQGKGKDEIPVQGRVRDETPTQAKGNDNLAAGNDNLAVGKVKDETPVQDNARCNRDNDIPVQEIDIPLGGAFKTSTNA